MARRDPERCGTPKPLNDREREAFRAYMHDLNRWAAEQQGADPDTICPTCGGEHDRIDRDSTPCGITESEHRVLDGNR